MSTFACPQLPPAQLANALEQMGVASLKPEHIEAPTSDILRSFFFNFLSYIDPLGEDPEGQIEFSALQVLENPENHDAVIGNYNLFRRVREVLELIGFEGFKLRDMMRPEPRRTSQILSSIVNFLFHREDRLNMLQQITDQFPAVEERRIELDEKINELNKKILDHEVSCQNDEPVVQELDAEVKKLRQTIQSYNNQYASSKAEFEKLKNKCQGIKEKISRADFELLAEAQENSKLLSKIVQSPDKLQRSLDEKRFKQAEVKGSERSAMQLIHKKTAILEAHSKANEKMSKHLSRMQAIQEQVNSNKAVEKDVKSLKATLSDQEVSTFSIESKIVEKEGKDNHLKQLVRAMEKDRDVRCLESTQRLEAVRAEVERKLNLLDSKEREAEENVTRAKEFLAEAESVKESGNTQQHTLQAMFEEILTSFRAYSNSINSFSETIETGSEKKSPAKRLNS